MYPPILLLSIFNTDRWTILYPIDDPFTPFVSTSRHFLPLACPHLQPQHSMTRPSSIAPHGETPWLWQTSGGSTWCRHRGRATGQWRKAGNFPPTIRRRNSKLIFQGFPCFFQFSMIFWVGGKTYIHSNDLRDEIHLHSSEWNLRPLIWATTKYSSCSFWPNSEVLNVSHRFN